MTAQETLPYRHDGTWAPRRRHVWFAREHRPKRQLSPTEHRDHVFDRLAIAAIYVFIVGGLVLRSRTGADIQADAADSAAQFRIAMDAAAAVLASIVLFSRLHVNVPRSRTAPATLLTYTLYTVMAALGLLEAVPAGRGLVAFRVFEMLVMLLVAWASVWRLTLPRVIHHIERILYLHIGLIALGGVVAPSLAFLRTRGGILPFRLQGGFPELSANTVGTVGVMLFALALVRGRHRWFNLFAGVALVLLSQYRTGYVACAAVFFVFLLVKPSATARIVALALAPIVLFMIQTSTFTSAWDRGENSADSLSGRDLLWSTSIDVAHRDTLLGTGLSSGFRYEVVPQLQGLYSDDIGSAHGTWIEAYLGTGWLGVAMLALFTVVGLLVCWRYRRHSLVPLILFATIAIRMLDGSTVELPGWFALVALILFASTEAAVRGQATDGTTMANGEAWAAEERVAVQ